MTEFEIPWTPTHTGSVGSQDDSLRARRLRPTDKRLGKLVVGRPVQLVPPVLARGRRYVFDGR